jgi:acyl carrier protein
MLLDGTPKDELWNLCSRALEVLTTIRYRSHLRKRQVLMEDPKQNYQSAQMIAYIVHEVIRRPGIQITEDTPLVSSGLIDSLALVNILLKLEDITEMRIPAGKVQPKNMDTVNLMLATAQRFGRPRK